MEQSGGAYTMEQMLEEWPEEQAWLKTALLALRDRALALTGAELSFVARPGVTNSLRFRLNPNPAGRERPVFFLVDAVPLDGEGYLLSVCFYENETEDPEELGNAIPQGLFGETGYCFDLDREDPALLAYCLERIPLAHAAAAGAA